MTGWWPTAAELDAERGLREQFPDWKIVPGLHGMVWSAERRRTRPWELRFVVAGSADELEGKLRSISEEEESNGV